MPRVEEEEEEGAASDDTVSSVSHAPVTVEEDHHQTQQKALQQETKEEEPLSQLEEEEEGDLAQQQQETPETAPAATSQPYSWRRIMWPKLIMATKLTCVLLTIIAAVQSRGPLVKKTPSAQPFFPRHSLVSDYYSGDVMALTERLLASDLSLVIYYAPWDRDSQLLRWEIEKVARYHHEQIYFAAVNCWHPRSECRARYKIRSFPAIVLHVRSSSGLETKAFAYGGPHIAAHIIRFLSRALRPLSHVGSQSDLAKLQLEYNSVVLGYYDFDSMSLIPKGFNSFFLASLRALQHDNSNLLAWGVVTNPRIARALSFNASRSVHIVLWNTTMAFTGAQSADSEAISNWVFKRLDHTMSWLAVPGTKSLALNNLFEKGPALILFTPDNPYHTTNDPYTLLREISLEYKNCEELSRVTSLVQYLRSVRSRGRSLLRQSERACRNYLQDQLRILHLSRQQLKLQDEMCCQSMLPATGTQEKLCDVCVHPSNKWTDPTDVLCTKPTSLEVESNLMQHVNSLMSVFSDSCRELVLEYSPWEHYSVCCQRNTTSTKSKPTDQPLPTVENTVGEELLPSDQKDDRMERLVSMAAEEQCKRLFHGSLLGPPALLKDQVSTPSITGLGCKTNKSLEFVAVDSLHHKNLAERLGVNLTARDPPSTAAVIVDLKSETHFVMETSISRSTLVNFILNYTQGLLDRTLVSGDVKVVECEAGQVCIQELSSNNYHEVTQTPGQMVVVLHYSRSCAACTSVGHVFMTVARMAQHIPNITFARIDALANALPWHLYFDSLPTVIVHPHFRKSESRIFDPAYPLTPANLMSFLVANISPNHRLTLSLSACGSECEEQVLQAARVTTMQLHHALTATTLRLQHVLERLARWPHPQKDQEFVDGAHWKAHHELLIHAKDKLIRDIRKQRSKLHHVGGLQTFFSSFSGKQNVPNYDEFLRSLQYVLQVDEGSKKSLVKDVLHEEL